MKSELENLPFADLAQLFTALSERFSRAMGGSSGILRVQERSSDVREEALRGVLGP